MAILETVKDEATLSAKIDAELPDIITEVDAMARPYLAAYEQVRKISYRIGILFGGGLITAILALQFGSIVFVVIGIILMSLGVGAYFRYYKPNVELRKQANQFSVTAHTALTQAAFRLVGIEAMTLLSQAVTFESRLKREWQQSSEPFRNLTGVTAESSTDSIHALVAASELITEPANRFLHDDMYRFTWHGQTVTVGELDVSHTTGSGKNKSTKHIFKGLFLQMKTNLTTTGKTFISTDGDRDGFGHQSFWTNLTGSHCVAETTLEWNEFENAFHVATDNPMEARYILTPDFMHVLYDWWTTDKRNIRISFVGTTLSILCPTHHVRMYKTITSLESAMIRAEIFSITRALLPLLHLLEVVRERTK